jgi:hypothetical protein
LVPNGVTDTVYLVVDCFGTSGCVWRETRVEATDFETIVSDLLRGEYSDPLRVVAFNTTEMWSRDASAEIARAIKQRCDRADEDVPSWLADLVHAHVAPERQLTLDLPLAAPADGRA